MEQPNKPQHRPAGIPASMRRPAAAPVRPATQAVPPPPPPPKPEPPRGKKSFMFAMISITVVSIIIVVGVIYMGIQKLGLNASAKSGKYQAVFLSNNMVYFGKLSNVTGEYVTLSDIYYLQVQQNQNGQTNNQNNNQNNQLSLTKLGGELHGPEDTMYINRKEVLFWENLKDDSKVVQAIKNYQSGNK